MFARVHVFSMYVYRCGIRGRGNSGWSWEVRENTAPVHWRGAAYVGASTS